ncbi:hypothetical protein KIN20_001860 [Parelaphostrongylus tenuis]|uniref:Uncharacterized protein n=1 Tax=Parelaphostrongylus tenuis TaxID=148309 RepID=A0AAD5QD24_PARTN|nr:hypothetical protein KIN20_001860 [Parelaphostrongylus tenuis]
MSLSIQDGWRTWMAFIQYCFLLMTSLFIHPDCPNHLAMALTSDEMEEVAGGSESESLNNSIYTSSDNFMEMDDDGSVNSTNQSVRYEFKAFHLRRYAHKKPAKCRKFSLREKYKLLEQLGGRNQRYMAETPEEASRSFVHTLSSPVLMKHADVAQENEYTPYCNKECEKIRVMLENALEQRQPKRRLWTAASLSQAQNNDMDYAEVVRDFSSIGNCSLDTFIPLGECTDRSKVIDSQGYELCSTCQGAHLLSENCFPSFIKSALCNEREIGCIFDYAGTPHGRCREEPLTLTVLRNHGSSECEDWLSYEIQIPIACQCFLSAHSWLRPTPRKKL